MSKLRKVENRLKLINAFYGKSLQLQGGWLLRSSVCLYTGWKFDKIRTSVCSCFAYMLSKCLRHCK